MSDVDALTAFIRARLDEEGAWAGAAGGGPWRGEHKVVWTPSGDQRVADTRSAVYARHIARQDPAATLARVAALRALVDWAAEWDGPMVLRHVAAIWRDHPDFPAE